MAVETTSLLPISHQVGLILMVGRNVTSTMSWEKATLCPSILADFVNDTESHSIPKRTQTWRGCPATTTTRAGRSLRASDAMVLSQYFASGIMSILSRSKILRYDARARLPCCASPTSSIVDGDPCLACGCASAGPCGGAVAFGIRGGGGPNFLPSVSWRHSLKAASVGLGGVGCSFSSWIIRYRCAGSR